MVAQGGFDVRGDNYGYYLEAPGNEQSDVMNSLTYDATFHDFFE